MYYAKKAWELFIGHKALFAVFFVALILRFVYFFSFATPGYYADGYVYTKIMHFLFNGIPIEKGIHLSWAPGYSIFLWAITFFTGENLVWYKIVQAVISAFMVFLVYLIGEKAFDKKTGLVAAAIWAFYPYSMLFAELIMSETLFMFMMALALLAVLSAVEKPSKLSIFVSGIFLGSLALVRASAKMLFLLVPVWLFFNKKWNVVLTAIAVAGALTVILPYIFFLFTVYGQFIFIDHVGEHTLLMTSFEDFEEINPSTDQSLIYNETLSSANEKPFILYFESAVKLLLNPGKLLTNVFDRVTLFFWVETFMAGQPTRNYYGAVSSSVLYNVFAYGSIVFYIFLMVLFVFGLSFSKSRFTSLFALFIVYFVAIHGFSHSEQRYHLQIMPIVIPVAAYAAVNLKTIFKSFLDFRQARTKAFFGLILALFAFWAWGFYNFILN